MRIFADYRVYWLGLCAATLLSSPARAGLLVASQSAGGGGDVLAYDSSGAPQGSYLGLAAGSFGSPVGIAIGSNGDLYIADAGNHMIDQFNPGTGSLSTFIPSGTGGLGTPIGLAFDGSGDLFVADSTGGGGQVLEFDSSGNLLNSGPFVANGAGTLGTPVGLAFDASGNLYVADSTGGGGQVLEYDSSGNLVGGRPFIGHGYGGLDTPTALAFDRLGNLFVADSGTGQILESDPSGFTVQTFATGLGDPVALGFDPSGNLFASDTGTGKVLKFDSLGNESTFITSGDGGLGTSQGLAYYEPPAAPVPEPSSLTLCGLALGCGWPARRTRKRNKP